MYIAKEICSTNCNTNPTSNFIYDFDRSDQKRVACLCSKCYSITGHLNYAYTNMYTLSSDDLSDSVMLSRIIPNIPFLDSFPALCKTCGNVEEHFTVDAGMEKIIQLLNRSGIKTMFSCEGHSVLDSEPYIAFEKDVSKYFDMSNKLLKYWVLEKYDSKSLCKSSLRLTIDASIEYIYSDKYLNDLHKYITKYIAIKNKKERKVKKKC